MLYSETLQEARFEKGASALVVNCQYNYYYNGQRQFVWADGTHVVLFCLQDGDIISNSVSSNVLWFEEEGRLKKKEFSLLMTCKRIKGENVVSSAPMAILQQLVQMTPINSYFSYFPR